MARRRKNRIEGQFSARTIEMLESPAYRALSLSARRVLDRIEIEQAHHGGRDNGRLPVTYDDFQRYGIDRHCINAAIHEVVALGFVEITEAGRAGNAEFRTPNKFRLTYRPLDDGTPPTNGWKRFATMADARMAAATIRRNATQSTSKRSPRNKNPVGENTMASGGAPHRNHSGNPPTTGHSGNPPTTIDISAGGDQWIRTEGMQQ